MSHNMDTQCVHDKMENSLSKRALFMNAAADCLSDKPRLNGLCQHLQ